MWVFLIVLVLLIAVVVILTSPWRRSGRPAQDQHEARIRQVAADVLDLEAARDAKYREIRDAELDRSTGHLSDADFETVDAGLRAEAIEILRRLDRAQARLEKLRAGGDDPDEAAAEADAAAPGLPDPAADELPSPPE